MKDLLAFLCFVTGNKYFHHHAHWFDITSLSTCIKSIALFCQKIPFSQRDFSLMAGTSFTTLVCGGKLIKAQFMYQGTGSSLIEEMRINYGGDFHVAIGTYIYIMSSVWENLGNYLAILMESGLLLSNFSQSTFVLS